MITEVVAIPGQHGLWRKTKAYSMYMKGNLGKTKRINTDMYIASCLFIMRYQEERSGPSMNWDSLFSRVQTSRRTYTPKLFWRKDLSKLDRRAYRILEQFLVEEQPIKTIRLSATNYLNDNDISHAEMLRRNRHGKRAVKWALGQFYTLLTDESFWDHHSHDPSRASARARA
jgi:hypothetical protein